MKKQNLLRKRELPGLRTASNYQFFGVMLTVCHCVLTAVFSCINRTDEQKLFLLSIPVHFSLQSLKDTCGKYLDGSDIDEACIKSGIYSAATVNQIIF